MTNDNDKGQSSMINDSPEIFNHPQNLSGIGSQVLEPALAEDTHLPLKMIWIDRNFFQEIIGRILESIAKIEDKLFVLKSKLENPSLCLKNRRFFQIINRLADLVEADLIREIARQAVIVLDKCGQNKLKVNRPTVDWLLASTSYIKKLCADFSLNYDPAFLAITHEHLNRFSVNEQDFTNLDTFGDTQIKKLGDILVEQKRLTQEELAELLAKQKEVSNKLKLGQIALSQEKIGPAELVESLKIQTDSIILSISDNESEYDPTPAYLKKLPGGKKDEARASANSPAAKGASHRKRH
ncbi:MAG: hypothetical protein K6U80_05830 [Firmicutes bacterium]|nr:hypothetical protein [Bacillota bacterium]